MNDWPTDAFEQFWKLYPVKIKRMSAEKAFGKLQGAVTMAQLLAGIKTLRAYMKANPWYSPPHASTWLNQQRWFDEYAEEVAADDTSWKLNRAMEETMRRRMQ